MAGSPLSSMASPFRAADAPLTNKLLKRRRVVCGVVIGLGIALVVLGVVVRATDAVRQRNQSSGRDPAAVITQIVPHIGGTGPSSSSATVTFHTADGVEHS